MQKSRVLVALLGAVLVSGLAAGLVSAVTCGPCLAERVRLGGDDPVIGVLGSMDIPSAPCVIWGDAYDHLGLRTNFNDIMEIGILHTDGEPPTLYTRCTWCTNGGSPQHETENHGTWPGGLNDPVILGIWFDDINKRWSWQADGQIIRFRDIGLSSSLRGARDVLVGGRTTNEDVDLGVSWFLGVMWAKPAGLSPTWSVPLWSWFIPSTTYAGYTRLHEGGRYITVNPSVGDIELHSDTHEGEDPPSGCYQ